MDASATSEGHKYAHLYNYSGSNKAGMDGMDKDKQAQIIYEMSKDSAYFKRAAKLDAEAEAKVQGLKKTLQEVKGPLEEKLRKDVQRMVLELEPRRSFKRICCVLDMDMFYAAVEIRDKPHLKDLPVAVGGMTMISTANYVARKYGVRAAMPGFIAKKLCPQLVFVDMNFDKYRHISEQVKDIIGEYDPDFTSHSLDEVYFDLTNAATEVWQKRHDGKNNVDNDANTEETLQERDKQQSSTVPTSMESVPDIDIFVLRSIAVEMLQEIRRRITEVTGGLTCSAGLANNHYLAKIGADVNKPDGQFELPPTREAVMDFVTTLATRKVTGIGKVTERMLDSLLGVKTMGQVRDHLPQLLHTVSPILFQFLLRTCMGIGSHEGEDNVTHELNVSEKKGYMRKSLGCERTFASKGICDPTELYARLHKICQHVADDMASEGLWAKAVTLKLKNIDFELITRIASAPQYFQSVETIESLAKTMLDEALPVNIRLMGVSVSKFKQPDPSEADPKQRNMLMFLKAREEQEAGPMEQSEKNVSVSATATTGAAPCLTSASSSAVAMAAMKDSAEFNNCIGIDEEENDSDVEVLADYGASTSLKSAHSSQPKDCWGESGVSISQQVHECPVCGAQVPGMMARFNQHLDMCLGLPNNHVEEKAGTEPTPSGTRKGLSGKGTGPKQATKSKSTNSKNRNSGPAPAGSVTPGAPKAVINPLLAAFSAASTGVLNTENNNALHGLATQKRPHDGNSAMKLSGQGNNSSSSSSSSSSGSIHSRNNTGNPINSDNPRNKMSRREPLALEITDYFTFQ